MLFKTKLVLCMLALTAFYARAQENTGKAGTQNQPGKTQTQNDQNRRDNPAQPNAQNRSSTSEDRNAQDRNAQDRNAQDRNAQDRNAQDRNAQDRNRNQRDATTRTETREHRQGAANESPLDSQLASCLLVGNQKEVTISQFASERAKHEKVKEFARQMVKDHTQAISMLQRFAGPDASKELSSSDATRTNRSETVRSTTTTDSKATNREGANRSPDASATDRTATNQADRNDAERNRSETSVNVRTEHDAMPDKMLAIQREVAQKCITMAKQELEQSNNFDQAYVGMQIAAHMGMIAELETFKSYASPDLGKVIQESLDTAQGHLRHAKELVMEISHDSASGDRNKDASRRSEASSRDGSARSSATRDDTTPRREGVIKKDAPKN